MATKSKVNKLRELPEVKAKLKKLDEYEAPLLLKKFDELTVEEKNSVLKIIAIKLNIVKE